jgi:non-heme chloroperoxidase
MLRSIYHYLISCHPASFRRRFGDEMSSIFDYVVGRRARIALIADASISLLRQWTVREQFREGKREVAVGCDRVPAPVFESLNSFRPQMRNLIQGAILTAFSVWILCFAFQYNWTHSVRIPFRGAEFQAASDELKSAPSPSILPSEETGLDRSDQRTPAVRMPEKNGTLRSQLGLQLPVSRPREVTSQSAVSTRSETLNVKTQTIRTGVEPARADSSPHKVRYVEVGDGVRLEVLDWGGSGRGLVLLAGLGDTAHVFDRFAPKLTTDYRVYGITRRGFGNSTIADATDANYSSDRLGDDVLAVMDSLHLTRPVIVGHSIAGEELSSIGSRFPKKVSGLVYLEAGYSYAFYDHSRGDLILDSVELKKQLDQLIPGREVRDRKHAYAALLATLPPFERELRIHQQETANIPEPESPAPKLSPVAQAIIGGEHKYTRINSPILAIFAFPHALPPEYSRDPNARAAAQRTDAIWTEAQVKAFEAGLPSARVVCLPNANHYVFQSNEADVLREINTFTRSLP